MAATQFSGLGIEHLEVLEVVDRQLLTLDDLALERARRVIKISYADRLASMGKPCADVVRALPLQCLTNAHVTCSRRVTSRNPPASVRSAHHEACGRRRGPRRRGSASASRRTPPAFPRS